MISEAPRILIVDDEPKICEFVGALLQREGYEVDSTTRPRIALEKLQAEPYSLIITDLKMPEMDGFEFSRQVRGMDTEIPLVMMTGFATITTAIQALREGVDDYVTKPFKIDEMRKVVSRVLAKAILAAENKRLLSALETTNAELSRHREALRGEVRSATDDLRRANTDLQRRVAELAMLNEIARAVSSQIDLDALLSNCVGLVMEKLSVCRASIMLCEDDELVVKAYQGPNGKDLKGLRQPIGEGVAGHVAQNGEPIHIKDISEDGRFKPKEPGRYASNSLVCVPISFKDEILGVVSVTDTRSGVSFTESDMKLLSTIAGQVAPSIENARLYKKLEESTFMAVCALVSALEAKDAYTCGHSMRVTRYAVETGKAMDIGDPDLTILDRASQLHDLGKLGVSDIILNKPSRLSDEEFHSIREHPVLGQQIMQPVNFLSEVADAVRQHHERPDGTGYPDGKRGDEINDLARIMSVADAFDAMTSHRPYRAAKNVEDACREIESLSGRQFDTDVAEVFCKEVVPNRLSGAIAS